MKIAIASDHAGFAEKGFLAAALREEGEEVSDLGPADSSSCDYPDYAALVAAAVARGDAECGILICGTGIGMSMAANKVPGCRAALCHGEWEADQARRHNGANVLCLGARVLAAHAMLRIALRFLATGFEGGRHARRLEKIDDLEKRAPA